MVEARRARYAEDNARAAKAAVEAHLAAHHLTGAAPAPGERIDRDPDQAGPGPISPAGLVVAAKAPARGLMPYEWILRAPEGGPGPPGLVLASSRCVEGDSCGCSHEQEYAFATAPDGHDVILRLSPRVHEHRVTQAGSCSVGCGMPSPPRPPSGRRLHGTDPARVEVADVPYDMDLLRVTCMTEIPAP
jgi:hypothetical protein